MYYSYRTHIDDIYLFFYCVYFRALEDIRESIKELQFYRSSIFKVPETFGKKEVFENGSHNSS